MISTVTVQQIDTQAEPVKLNIKPGDTYQRIDLLRALLVKSPNDVARCLARDNAGSIEAVCRKDECQGALSRGNSFELRESEWSSYAGPVFDRARSLAYRPSRLTPTPRFARSSACRSWSFVTLMAAPASLENTNKVLKRLPYCNGMKTGYTEAAGHCSSRAGPYPGRDVIVVVLGDSESDAVWQDASALLSWGLRRM